MERKNTMLLTVVAVATLLVAVVGATFAYFTATGNITQTSTVQVTTSSVDSVSGTATDCSMAVTGTDMRQGDGTAEGAAKTSPNCKLEIIGKKSENNTGSTTCTYDITYTPSATGKLEIRGNGNSDGKKELSLVGSATTSETSATLSTSAYAETDLYNVTTKTTLVNNATFTFSEDTTATWTFNTKFYNYNFDQNNLADKSFGGILAIENLSCTASAS